MNPIILDMATADERHKAMQARWQAGETGEDLLAYMAECCGWPVPARLTVGDMMQAETYRYMHEIATQELGYESILEALEAAPHADDEDKPDTYQIGPLTVKYVFGPFGKPDGAEWQTVLDTVEHELKTREYMSGQLAEETP